MTREDQIKIAMCDNLSTKGNVVSGLTKAATAISQLFDHEMIEFAEWKDLNKWKRTKNSEGHYRWKKGSFTTLYTTAKLLQLFKDNQ